MLFRSYRSCIVNSIPQLQLIDAAVFRQQMELEQTSQMSNVDTGYVLPNIFSSPICDVYDDPDIQEMYTKMHTHLEHNQTVQRLRTIGLKKWHRGYFTLYMKILQIYRETHQQAGPTTYLNFRYARDYSGKFFSENMYHNYNNPVHSLKCHPRKFYDISCTTDIATFGVTNLDIPKHHITYKK